MAKGKEGTLWGDGHAVKLGGGGDLTSRISQNTQDRTLKLPEFTVRKL